MSESTPARRITARLLTASTLVLLVVVVALDHGRLVRIERSLHESDREDGIARLTARYAALAGDVEALKAAPPAASEAAMDAFQSGSDTRLSQLEKVSAASTLELTALEARLEVLERRSARAARRAPVPATNGPTSSIATAANPEPSAPAPLDPPFLPLGIELRGGEQFLLIVPSGASSIAKARALRLGDREAAWTLERLERNAAEFRVEGQFRRLSVPQ